MSFAAITDPTECLEQNNSPEIYFYYFKNKI